MAAVDVWMVGERMHMPGSFPVLLIGQHPEYVWTNLRSVQADPSQKVTRLRLQGMEVQCTQVEQRDYSRVKPKEMYPL